MTMPTLWQRQKARTRKTDEVFDSCAGRVTLAEVAEDIANDLAFEKYLKKLHENKEREKAHNKDKEKDAYDKKTCNC